MISIIKTDWIWLKIVIALMTVATPSFVSADESEPVRQVATSPLLVLLAARDDTSIAVERQLVGELRLTLDTMEVEQVVIDREDFLSLTLPAQLSMIQPMIRRFMARAVVWVTIGNNGGHLIQFVVTDRGNATVRTVEAGSAEELALAVRELLDSSYLFEGRQNPESGKKPAPWFSVASSVSLSGGISGHKGSSLCGGMGVSGRFDLPVGLFMGLDFDGKYGPVEKEFDGLLTGWRLEMGIHAGYLFKLGKFGIGPYGEATALRSFMNAVLKDGAYEKYKWWSFRGALGIEAKLKITDLFSLLVDWTVGGIAGARAFERTSNHSTALATPIIDYSFSIGFMTGIL